MGASPCRFKSCPRHQNSSIGTIFAPVTIGHPLGGPLRLLPLREIAPMDEFLPVGMNMSMNMSYERFAVLAYFIYEYEYEL